MRQRQPTALDLDADVKGVILTIWKWYYCLSMWLFALSLRVLHLSMILYIINIIYSYKHICYIYKMFEYILLYYNPHIFGSIFLTMALFWPCLILCHTSLSWSHALVLIYTIFILDTLEISWEGHAIFCGEVVSEPRELFNTLLHSKCRHLKLNEIIVKDNVNIDSMRYVVNEQIYIVSCCQKPILHLNYSWLIHRYIQTNVNVWLNVETLKKDRREWG